MTSDKAASTPSVPELFTPPDEILSRFEIWAAKLPDRPFSSDDIERLRQEMPASFQSTLRRALVLDVWLGDARATYRGQLSWNEQVYGRDRVQAAGLVVSIATRRSDDGTPPCARWALLDLAANAKPGVAVSARTLPDGGKAAGFAVLAAAAQHPSWVQSMRTGKPVSPPVVIRGVTVTRRRNGAAYVLTLGYSGLNLEIGAIAMHKRVKSCAWPTQSPVAS